jgi:putative transposase
VVFTLPAEIAPIAYQNKAVVYHLLLRAAAETLLTIAADPKHLGARIGATAVLHTWGSAMTHHPHVHMIVPGGGISLDGTRWVHCKPGFLLPVRVLSHLFLRLFQAALADAHAAGRLAFFGEIEGLRRRKAFAAYLAPLIRKNWFVYAKPPFAGPEAVLAYLARYTHRVAISNSRLLGLDARGVTFRYKDYRRHGRARFSDDVTCARRVHQALSAPCSVQGVPSHPPLWIARQRQLQSEHRACQRADRCAPAVDQPGNGA